MPSALPAAVLVRVLHRLRGGRLLCALLLSLLGPVLTSSAGFAPALAADDQDKARRALELGEIHSLDEVLKAVRAAVPGEVVKLDLKREDRRWLYRLRVLTPQGRRREVRIDAASLEIVADDDDDDD